MVPVKRSSKLRDLALLAASTVLCTVLLEGMLQVYARLDQGRWLFQTDPAFRVGYVVPVADRREYSLQKGYDDGLYVINDDGFRGPPIVPDRPGSVVAVIGDSVPFGAGVTNEQTFPHHLESLFRRPGLDVRVLNAGVPSYNLRQSFDRLRLELLDRYRPALVIVQAANDLSLLSHYREDWTPDRTWMDVRWRQTEYRRLALYHYLVAPILGFRKIEFHTGYSSERFFASVRALLYEQLAALDAAGTPVVLLPVNPHYYQTANRERNRSVGASVTERYFKSAWNDNLLRLNGEFEAAAAEFENVHFLDVRAIFDRQDRSTLFTDFIHLSETGAKLQAQALYDFILERNLLHRS